jgi:RNA polymerase sigma factor (sigma-70 family)
MPANPFGLLLRQVRGLVAPDTDGDATLLSRFVRERDEGAFAALVQRHGPAVFGLCRRWLGHEQDAEDAFQAVFLVLARKAGSIRKGQALASWLHGVALRLCRKARGDAARRRVPPGVEPPLPPDPLESLTARELLQVVDEELARLPERYRAPLVLCYLQGRTQEEAARELGWSKSTLRRRLGRGRDLLRVRLGGRGVTALAALAAGRSSAEAAVSGALVEACVRAVRWFLSGQGQAASVGAATLAEHGMRLLAGPKVKALLGLVATLCLLSLATGMVVVSSRSPEPGPAAPSRNTLGQAEGPRRDLFGDLLPPGALARLGTLRFRVGSGRWMGFSPDGKTLGVCKVLWDTATGKQLRVIEGAQEHPFGAYSPDFRLLATWGGEKSLRIWDVATGEQLPSLKGDLSWTYLGAFSGDGRRLATARQGKDHHWEVRVWDLDGGHPVATLERETDSDLRMALAPDGRTLATFEWRNGGFLHVLDVATGKGVLPFPARIPREWKPQGREIAFSPNGKTLAAAGTLWDVASGLRVADVPDLVDPVRWSPDGKTLATGPRLLDVASGKLRVLEGSHVGVEGTLFSPDGRRVAGVAHGGTLWVWDAATGTRVNRLEGHQGIVCSIALSHDGSFLASVSFDGTLRLWDATTGQERCCRRLEGAAYGSADYLVGPRVALSPDGRLVALTLGNAVSLRDAATGDEVRRLAGHADFVTSVAFAPDGTLASASRDHTIRLWDPATGREVRRLEGHTDEVHAVAVSPDGRLLASGAADHALCVWDVASGREVGLVGWQKSEVRLLAFSPDGTTLAAVNNPANSPYSTAGPIHLWDRTTGKERGALGRGAVTLAFSPDGRTLAADGDGCVDCWDVTGGKVLRKLPCPRTSVTALAFSADGRRLASACADTTMLIWDTEDLMKR